MGLRKSSQGFDLIKTLSQIDFAGFFIVIFSYSSIFRGLQDALVRGLDGFRLSIKNSFFYINIPKLKGTMNISRIEINKVNSPLQLKNFLEFRENEAKAIVKNITQATEDLGIVKTYIDNPGDFKSYLNFIGRKIKLLDDPLTDSIKMAKELNPLISSLAKSHALFVMNFVVSSNEFIRMLPFDAKMVIIKYLDRIYVQETDELNKKIEVINKKLGTR